jgi:hypothetical protein
MDFTNSFFADIFEEFSMLRNGMRDNRPEAVKDHAAIEYAMREAVYASEDMDTEAAYDYDELEYNAWDERICLEPAWTDAEEDYDILEMDQYDAESFTDASAAWYVAELHVNR